MYLFGFIKEPGIISKPKLSGPGHVCDSKIWQGTITEHEKIRHVVWFGAMAIHAAETVINGR